MTNPPGRHRVVRVSAAGTDRETVGFESAKPVRSVRPGVELVVLVDADDAPLGAMEKLSAHRGEGRLHRAFSVFVFDDLGRTLLQKRAETKYHFAGLWTNACCGHPRPGETPVQAGRRRLTEEMGIEIELREAGVFRYHAEDRESGLIEREIDHVLVGTFRGEPDPDPSEASGWRWVDPDELTEHLERGDDGFTPWLAPAWSIVRDAGISPGAQPDS